MNVLRVFTVSVVFLGIFATFSKFSKTEKKCKNPSLIHKKAQDLNVFRSPAISVAFYSNLLHLQIFKKLKKNTKHISVSKKPKLEFFEQSYFFRTHSSSFLLRLAICKEIMFYIWKNHLFLRKNKLCTFSEFLWFQSPSTGNLQHWAYLIKFIQLF